MALGNKEFCFWQGKEAENVVFFISDVGTLFVSNSWYCQIQTTRLIMLFLINMSVTMLFFAIANIWLATLCESKQAITAYMIHKKVSFYEVPCMRKYPSVPESV